MQRGIGRFAASKQSERTGGRGNDSNVADTDSDDGRHRSGTESQKRKARVEHGRGGKRQLSENPTRMWPTPTARDYKDTGENTNYEAIAKKGKLSGAVMFPTPTANEDAAGTPKGKMQKMLGNDPEVRGVSPEEWKRGALNPTWVEWLMGYPEGWTELED